MKTRLLILSAAWAFAGVLPCAHAQLTARTLEGIQDIQPDGSVNLTFQLAFDAKPWDLWKANVGSDPARLRAMMRYQFSAYVIDDFKFEKDDLNRTAKITMHSPAGPELRKDQRFQVAVDGWCRLISHSGREWFFSGNNPAAANNLTTIKLVLPPNAVEATVINAGTPEQALVYAVKAPGGLARILEVLGAAVAAAGLVVLIAGVWWEKRHPHAVAPPSHLPTPA